MRDGITRNYYVVKPCPDLTLVRTSKESDLHVIEIEAEDRRLMVKGESRILADHAWRSSSLGDAELQVNVVNQIDDVKSQLSWPKRIFSLPCVSDAVVPRGFRRAKKTLRNSWKI